MSHSMDLEDKTGHRASQDPLRSVTSPIIFHVVQRGKYTLSAPSLSKPINQRTNFLRHSLALSLDLIPFDPIIFKYLEPDPVHELIGAPVDVIECCIILFKPQGPQDYRPNCHPMATNLIKLLQYLVKENLMFPCERIPRPPHFSRSEEGIHDMNPPLPRLTKSSQRHSLRMNAHM
jgi:hypothetical protein